MAYHKIDSDSVNSITNALDFFQIPPTNVSVSSSKVFEILPSNPLNIVPYHFRIHSSQNFIDLTKCYLLTEFRIRKKNATTGAMVDLDAYDNVAPCQMIGSTFIKDMKITINGREIFNANSLMAYKSYLTNELSFSPTAKSSYMSAAGYYYDMNADLEAGESHAARRTLFANSRVAQFITRLEADIFNQPSYLVNFCQIDMEILPNTDKFMLVADKRPADAATEPNVLPEYELELLACKLYVKQVEVMDSLALEIARKLETSPARYAIRKSMCKAIFISQGRFEFNQNLFTDQIPRRVTLGLVSSSDYLGNRKRSPFNFQPFDVREISIVANGRSYPQASYSLDYENGNYVRAYNDMMEAVGLSGTMEGNGISYTMFGKTHCIYVFNLTNSGDDQPGLFDLIRNGTTAVSIKFAKPVPADGVELIAMGEADTLLLLDKNRSISTDTTI